MLQLPPCQLLVRSQDLRPVEIGLLLRIEEALLGLEEVLHLASLNDALSHLPTLTAVPRVETPLSQTTVVVDTVLLLLLTSVFLKVHKNALLFDS